MRKKTMILIVAVMALSLPATGGCKKNDAAQKSPEMSVVKFTSSQPTNLPNVLASPGGGGIVEKINGVAPTEKTKVNKKNRLSIVGWVANDKDGPVPSVVIIQLSSTSGKGSFYASAAKTMLKRPDVAKKANVPSLANSGFQLDADISAIPKGTYLISFLLSDGKYIIGFDSNTSLEIE